MKMWEIAGSARGDGYGEREEEMFRRELERAYEEGRRDGCREGYEKAMRETRSGYGERGGYGERDDASSSSGYGERRGVRGTGPYSRYR